MGVIHACVHHIELSQRPYLSAALAYEVHNFYAVYHTAGAELLIVRANMIALHPSHFVPTAAQTAAKNLEAATSADVGRRGIHAWTDQPSVLGRPTAGRPNTASGSSAY